MTVTVTPHHLEPLAEKRLPAAPRIIGIDCVYRLYPGVVNISRKYPDGTPLVETHVFETQIDAERWVTEDDRQRRAVRAAKGRA